jgi:class 3 adenylate cyclase/predicted ATPase
MEQIADWLKGLGMSEYAGRFAENRIDFSVLRDLTDQDLKDLGVVLGDRRKMLRAIAALGGSPALTSPAPSPIVPGPASAVAPPVEAAVGERRYLTVMFCDLVGSTGIAAQLDAEDWRDLVETYMDVASAAVLEMGGHVAKRLGDGLMSLFGYPVAHENDAERAARAALGIQHALSELNLRNIAGGKPELACRIGLEMGSVVVDAAGEIFGDAPNIAARVQALAEPGAVLVTARVQQQIARLFVTEEWGAHAIKGVPEPTVLFRLLPESGGDRRVRRRQLTPLIGRDEEIGMLLRRWERARQGDGQLVLIVSEPGLGKSRLIEEFRIRLRETPHTWIEWSCSQLLQNTPFHPITEWGRRRFGGPELPSEQRLAELESTLVRLKLDPVEIVPLVAPLLDIPIAKNRILTVAPDELRRRQLAALTTWAIAGAKDQPMVLVFQDLHWADPTTLEVLRAIAERSALASLLVLATTRPEFKSPWPARAHHGMISLAPLDHQQVRQMVAELAAHHTMPSYVIEDITDRTGGVPLFVEEVTRLLLERGSRSGMQTIPPTLQQSLMARLDRLGAAREVSQIGAVIGRGFTYPLLRAVAGMEDAPLQAALECLADADIVLVEGLPPAAEYRFKHALIQDAAYETLLKSRRRIIHRRVAATLEEKFPEIVVTHPALLAHHCSQAGLIEKAVGYWLVAGQQSVARSAAMEAVVQLRKGLELLSRVSDAAVRQQNELDLQMTLGRALIATSGHAAPEAGEAFARARQLCDDLDRPPQLVPALFGQFTFHLIRGELERAECKAEEVARLGKTGNNPRWEFAGAMASGHACFYTGKFVQARVHYDTAMSLWDSTYRNSNPTPEDALVSCQLHLYRTLLCLGYVSQARLRRQIGLAEAGRLSSYNQAFALCTVWYGDWVIERRKSAEAILALAAQLSAISREHGFPLYSAFGRMMSGWSLGVDEAAAKGIDLMLQGIAEMGDMGCKLTLPFGLMALAELYGRAGQADEGLDRLAEAAKVVEATQERWADPEMHRLRGSLLLLKGEAAAAEKSYEQALAVAQRQSAKFWELLAALDLACLWREQGKRIEARDLLEATYNWFTEGFDTPVLQDAKALLEQLKP